MNRVEELQQELEMMPLLREVEDWSEEAWEEYLDERDSEAFETQWMQAFEAIQRLEEETTLDTTTIDEIRKAAFLKAFDVTGNRELTGYISDDFELIAKGLHFEYSSDFLTSMYHRYKKANCQNEAICQFAPQSYCYTMNHRLSVVVLLLTWSACQSPEAAHPPKVLDGQALSVQHCGSCHAYPAPSLLDKATWQRYMLPRMAHRLGIYANDSVRPTLIEAGPGGARVEQAGVYPTEPQITEAEWTAIQKYYLQEAPTALDIITHAPLTIGLPHFQVQVPNFRLSPPSTTMVKIQSGGFWLGDANTKRLYQFDAQQQLRNAANVREGAISLDNSEESLRVTVMGSFSPTDAPTGLLLSLPLQPNQKPTVLLKDLQRPVHSAFADLNGDGQEDIITCEFGKWTGQLSWWEGAEDGTYARHVLRAQPGATRVYVRDLNDDQHPDLLALFAQGDEGIFAYYNQGDGTFTEQPVLRFPPSYGSSYFNLFDFNGDGHEDIIYTAGDNADYPPIVKPYHGIRIFFNDGQQHFEEAFFYPLPGAYHAIPADFDQDGDIDIATISFFPDYQHTPEESFVYLENQGNAENPFQFKGYTFPEVNQGRWIVMDAGDMDQDGDVDLILGSLSFEVVPANGMLEQWVKNGVPYIILENKMKN